MRNLQTPYCHMYCEAGTMQYMSPERLNGGGTGYSWPADVWSAGLIMLECGMGQHPYAAIGETV